NTDKDGKTAKDQAGQQPLLVLSGPAGIVSTSEQSQTVSAGQNLNLMAQRDANQVTGRRWIHNVGQHISLFVAGVKDKVALKLIAAKGKVQVQAQSDAMELTADQELTITAVKGKAQIAASQEVLLSSGGGYIRIAGGNIEIHCPSEVSVKGASHQLSGPASLSTPMPVYAKPGTGNLQVIHEFANGYSMNQGKFVVTDALGVKHSGVLDEAGKAMVNGLPLGPAEVQFLGRPNKDKADIFPFVAQPEEAVKQLGGEAVKKQAMSQLSSLVGKAVPPGVAAAAGQLAQAKNTVDQARQMAGQAQSMLQQARDVKQLASTAAASPDTAKLLKKIL
ncbi:DUF2345 domain-containing protein, partial [Chromobacterium vaccinii]|uniref:DUF2345 domain-containing protein n=1 Tax=Chromobacterium vaccinii TaxID=1108595 RepID=UPI003C716C80